MSNPSVAITRAHLADLDAGRIVKVGATDGRTLTLLMAQDAPFHRLDQWDWLVVVGNKQWNMLAGGFTGTFTSEQGDFVDVRCER